jgi:hypothetical protein
MRRTAILSCAAILALSLVPTSQAAFFAGNGATGFGGPVGTGGITVSDNAGNIDFSFTAGVPFSGNALIIYVDTSPGGVADTSTLNDTSDPGRTAISGANSGNPSRTVATFAPGFGADLAITLEPGVFSGLFDLSTPANFGFVASGNLAGTGAGPYTFSFSRAQLGLDPTETLNFVGTLISTSAYRSNETLGTSLTVPGSGGDAPNAGFNGTTTFSETLSYVVPEPASLGIIGLGGLLLARRSRR